jgi:hypothetical protein
MLANLYLDLTRDMSPDEVHAYMRDKLQLAGEILSELALRALAEVSPEQRDELAGLLDLPSWPVRPQPARLAAEAEVGGKRRRALPPVIRDMERTLGRVPGEHDAAALTALVDRAFAGPAQAAG